MENFHDDALCSGEEVGRRRMREKERTLTLLTFVWLMEEASTTRESRDATCLRLSILAPPPSKGPVAEIHFVELEEL